MLKPFVHCLLWLALSSPLLAADPIDGPDRQNATTRTDRVLAIGDARVRLSILHGGDTRYDDKLTRWIRYGLEAVTQLYGRFPLPRAQVVVFASGPQREIVPWGEVKRGRVTAAHLYVDQTRSLSTLINDWTLIHELSHMIHPYLGKEGRWFSEGVASYYQNVLQARVGTLTPRAAWQELHEGFVRGQAGTRRGRSLLDASINMHQNRDYMRVYWSGAAIALLADWQLRKQGGSLDRTLSRFQKCCLPAHKTWKPADFMRKLDTLSESSVFTDLYGRYINKDHFPQLGRAYQALGIDIMKDRVRLQNTAEDVAIREQIIQSNSTVVLDD